MFTRSPSIKHDRLFKAMTENNIVDALKLAEEIDDFNKYQYYLNSEKTSFLHYAVVRALIAADSRTPTELAKFAQWLKLVTIMVRKKANVNYQDASGNTPLHYAVDRENAPLTEVLLCVNELVAVINHNGQMLIHLTAHHRHTDVLELLLKRRFKLDSVDNVENTLLHLAVIKQNDTMLLTVLKKGLKPSLNWYGQSPLQLAVAQAKLSGNWSQVYLLIAYDAKMDNEYVEVLLQAYECQQTALVELLLEKGVGTAALLKVLKSLPEGPKQKVLVEQLIAAGARVDAVDAEGKTAIELAYAGGKWELIPILAKSQRHIADKNRYAGILLKAAKDNKTEVVIALCKLGVSAVIRDASNEHLSPLHYAAQHNNMRMAEALLKIAYADTRLHDSHNPARTALQYAIELQLDNYEFLKLLRDREFINNPQNTHTSKLENSVIASIRRLEARYNSSMDITRLRAEINAYLTTISSRRAGIVRAVIDPVREEFIKKYEVYGTSPERVLGLIWLAIHDRVINPSLTERDIEDRKQSFITNLISIQYAHGKFYCPQGSMNRLLQTLEMGAHPDVQLEYDINEIEAAVQHVPDLLAEKLQNLPQDQQDAVLKTWNANTEPAFGFLQLIVEVETALIRERHTVDGRELIASCEIKYITDRIQEAPLPAAFHPLCGYYNQLMVDRGDEELPCAWLAEAIYPYIDAYFKLSNSNSYQAHYQQYQPHLELYQAMRCLVAKPTANQFEPLLANLRPVIMQAIRDSNVTKLTQLKSLIRLLSQLLDKGLVVKQPMAISSAGAGAGAMPVEAMMSTPFHDTSRGATIEAEAAFFASTLPSPAIVSPVAGNTHEIPMINFAHFGQKLCRILSHEKLSNEQHRQQFEQMLIDCHNNISNAIAPAQAFKLLHHAVHHFNAMLQEPESAIAAAA